MKAGDTVGERFEIERTAGVGGMGTVYRARDRHTGAQVALKILHGEGGHRTERFKRESLLLAELSHPRIVRYIAHGETLVGECYLAMEWLEGEDLAARLMRSRLTVSESVTVVKRAAEALAMAHARGLVHRDIKPGNLFLPEGDLERVKLLDFGLARISRSAVITRTGVQVGTPGYMAPEQARGGKEVDARADVFSLGCVLYHCLTGHRAFRGSDAIAVLAKVLFEDAPRVSEWTPGVPRALDDLISRMLSKEPALRPADAAVVAAALDNVGGLSVATLEAVPQPTAPPPASLTTGERRLLSVVLARGDFGPVRSNDEATVSDDESLRAASLEAVARTYGGRMEALFDGSRVVTLTGTRAATDQAAQAARCAIALRRLLPNGSLSLATGRGEVDGKWPVGEAIDRAVRLLSSAATRSAETGTDAAVGSIHIDVLTAGLLDARFDVVSERGELTLRGERASAEAARTLLGKPTPCVGRERELAILSAFFEESVGEPVARAVLVTGDVGIGKSRLRHEFLSKLNQRDEVPQVWIGRGDPISAGSPFGIIGQALRGAIGMRDGEPLASRRQRLRTKLAHRFEGADLDRVCVFLGEIVGTSFQDEESPLLRAARRDAIMMGDQLRRAWEDCLAAECNDGPLVLVLEDLHWGDLPTVSFVDAALRALADRPFFVLALARPTIHDLFPKLWMDRGAQTIVLAALTRKAAERLVRKALGDQIDGAVVLRLVDRAQGNAFFLEELIRSVAEKRGDALPETVLAMAQARLEALEPEARRVLRAASVFGPVFWRGGVAALMGTGNEVVGRDEWLDELETREVVTRRSESKFPGDVEYVFRHMLVSEAAYAMLTERDRSLGHKLAGAWLEERGELDAMALAGHFERGEEPARALGWYRRAAAQALEANDFAAVVERADRAIACGARGQMLGELRLMQAEASDLRGDSARARRATAEAMSTFDAGGALWWRAATQSTVAACAAGDADRMTEMADAAVRALDARRESKDVAAGAVATIAQQLVSGGLLDKGTALLERLDWMFDSLLGESDLAAGAPFADTGDMRSGTVLITLCKARVDYGYSLVLLGAHDRATRVLRDAVLAAERMGLKHAAASARQTLGLATGLLGAVAEGVALLVEARTVLVAQGNARLVGGCHEGLARFKVALGDLDGAEADARAAIDAQKDLPASRASTFAHLALVLLAKGRVTEAMAAADEGRRALERPSGGDKGESLIRLVHAEALYAGREVGEAKVAIASARDRLLERAEKISDPDWRKSFLVNVPDHSRTLALATAWVDAG
jgi:tetratricopeptide (TPR) repeat protein